MERLSGPSGPDPDGGEIAKAATPTPRIAPPPRRIAPALGALILISLPLTTARGDTLAKVRAAGKLVYGGDMEGGGPYIYLDPGPGHRLTGFEVELMARLAGGLGVEAELGQGPWDTLLPILGMGRVDAVVNGYEWTDRRARDYLTTRPYYVFQLQVMAPRGGPVHSWDDLTGPKPGGGRWKVGVLGGSAAETFARREAGSALDIVATSGATDAMLAAQNGQFDATLQDVPAARFYGPNFPGLEQVGPPVGHGYYVIYLRDGDRALRDALDAGIGRLVESGELRRLLEKYRIWTDAQAELSGWSDDTYPRSASVEDSRGARLAWSYREALLKAAGMTVFLALASMPLAIGLGLCIALGRLYGPSPARWALSGYVELIRGTPLMLQLFVLFYVLRLDPIVAGVAGLAINYSAYEAEIYRAGLQAIPAGQMEAALALGMSRGLALRRVIVPQAVRIVIPPVTNDFIALFKDTSVTSVVTLVELTKQYSILSMTTGGVVEFGVAAAALYMLMGLPLSWFSRWFERRLDAEGRDGGATP